MRGWRVGEVAARAVAHGEKYLRPSCGRARIVALDKAARAPHHEEAHQLAPVVGMGTLLKGRQRVDPGLILEAELTSPISRKSTSGRIPRF